MGIADLCILQMEREGIRRKDARSRIFLMDAEGLITQNRLHMEKEHIPYAKAMPETKSLLEVTVCDYKAVITAIYGTFK